MNVMRGDDWPAIRDRLRQRAENLLGAAEWIETAQLQLGFGEDDIFGPGYIRFDLLANKNGTVVDRDLKALYELFLELEQRFYTAQISLEKARAKMESDE